MLNQYLDFLLLLNKPKFRDDSKKTSKPQDSRIKTRFYPKHRYYLLRS